MKKRTKAEQRAVDDGLEPTWFEESDPKKAVEKMLARYREVEKNQSQRRERNLDHAKLYSNQDLSSIYDYGVSGNINSGNTFLSVNVTESCVNTLAAKTTRTRIRPVIQTERGKRSQRRRAEGMTQFLDGCGYSSELHEGEGEQMFVDGGLFGTGVAFTDHTPDLEILTERVIPDEMLIDDTAAINGVRSLLECARKKYVHQEQLMRWPDGKGGILGDDKEMRVAIRKAGCERIPGMQYRPEASKMVPVYSAWSLPSRRGADDGRVLIGFQGAPRPIKIKVWKRMRLPFDFFIFQRRTAGIWGRSLAEQLVPIQLKINELLEVIDDGQEAAAPRTFYQSQAINPDDFDNELGRLIEVNGPPQQMVWFHPGLGASDEMYKDLETWIRRAYEVTGISMLSATAEKPEGISSAVALRELLDREDLRFAPLGKRWERFHKDIARNQIEEADELYEGLENGEDGDGEKRKLSVQVPGDKFLRTIDWGEVRMDRDKYTVTIGAASSLPTTPAARKQYAADLLEMGIITKARFAEIVDESGDVKAATSMVTAAQTAIELDIEDILEHGKYRAPDPLLDPELARDMGIQEYAKARHEDVAEDRMEGLRRYIMMAVKYSGPQKATAEPAQPNAAEQADAAAAGPPVPVGGEPPPGTGPDAAVGMSNAQDVMAAAPPPLPAVQPVG